MGYSLRTNRKSLASGNKNPPSKEVRNQQFEYIKKKREEFAKGGHAIISVDTKKRELLGAFKNCGKTYRQEPEEVFDHDFPSDAQGVAIPYGVYDPQRNRGSVFVGTSFDTAEFAVDAIASWWREVGRSHYGSGAAGRPKLLILADCGGSNSARTRLWKVQLKKVLCQRHGLEVTVCHYPPGASKWNPIEHRQFSEISKNWAGCPLKTYETILNYIRTTRTESGLRLRANLITKAYKKGIKISNSEFKKIDFQPHETLPGWNYSVFPS